jgi:O-acetylserine/cysteine efflux transporter
MRNLVGLALAVGGLAIIGMNVDAVNWLLARHSAAVFTPTALLVPVFGMAASSLVLDEPLYGWKLAAAGLIVAGLGVNMFGGMVRARFS